VKPDGDVTTTAPTVTVIGNGGAAAFGGPDMHADAGQQEVTAPAHTTFQLGLG
jgi:hypothetical protein